MLQSWPVIRPFRALISVIFCCLTLFEDCGLFEAWAEVCDRVWRKCCALTPFEDLWICLKFGRGSVGVGDRKLVWVWDSFSFLESSASRVVFFGGSWRWYVVGFV